MMDGACCRPQPMCPHDLLVSLTSLCCSVCVFVDVALGVRSAVSLLRGAAVPLHPEL